MLLLTNFMAKCQLVFCLSTGKPLFVRSFILKPTERPWVTLKNGTKNFQYEAILKTASIIL